MQSNRSFQIVEFLRECIGQAGKPSNRHAHREILALYIACAYVLCIGIALAHFGYNLDDWGWGVFSGCVMLAIITVQLCQSGEVYIGTESVIDCVHVKAEAVRRKLPLVC